MALSSTEFYCSWPTVEQKVPLVHVPLVHAQKRFGGYGNLRGWLLAALKAAYPQVLDTSALLDAADAAFGLTFESQGAPARFRDNSLAKALRVAAAAGEVERLETAALRRNENRTRGARHFGGRDFYPFLRPRGLAGALPSSPEQLHGGTLHDA